MDCENGSAAYENGGVDPKKSKIKESLENEELISEKEIYKNYLEKFDQKRFWKLTKNKIIELVD